LNDDWNDGIHKAVIGYKEASQNNRLSYHQKGPSPGWKILVSFLSKPRESMTSQKSDD